MENQVSANQQERLEFIDWCINFLGRAYRRDLCAYFGIKSAAATRDFALYRALTGGRIRLGADKSYRPAEGYSSFYELSLNKIAYWRQKKGISGNMPPLLPVEMPPEPYKQGAGNIAALSRAVHQKQAVTVSYYSLESGRSRRDIFPFALVNNGLRWHARAYDLSKKRFADFVIGRIDSAEASDAAVPAEAAEENDFQWRRQVELILRPHPGNVRNPGAIEQEYSMTGGRLTVITRAALAGYVLRAWNVDCSSEHNLKGSAYHLWLENRAGLDGVDSLILAPGAGADKERQWQ